MTTENKDNLIERPPVVVIMGHIDHGKSTLLDYIRKENTVSKEAGGITQHIAAYEVSHKVGDAQKRLTFLDTPGHEAFCTVRSRGAQIADIAILIVSAEDGVMPQTVEALKSIKEDGMPFVVAINKIDSPRANIEVTKQSLAEHEVYLEGYGGNVSFTPISAKTGDGINELIDLLILTAEIEEFKGDPDAQAEGYVIEAHKDEKKGISATVVIKNGTLKKGHFISSETSLSPIRAIENQLGENIPTASFSTPVTISGWNNIPPVGADFKSFEKKKDAKAYCSGCTKEIDENLTLDSTAEVVIPLIIKSDVLGSAEAIIFELQKVQNEDIGFKVISVGTGNISEADMKMAGNKEGTVVVGFNVGMDNQADAIRERDSIKTKTFDIIYELTTWLKDIAIERKPIKEIEEISGEAKVLRVFSRSKQTSIIGGKVKEGVISVGDKVKIFRRNEEIALGTIKGLQQQKVSADSIQEGNEFGTAIETPVEIAESDHFTSFSIVKK